MRFSGGWGPSQAAAWAIVLLHVTWCVVEAELQPLRRWGTADGHLRLPLVAGALTGLVVLVAIVDARPGEPARILAGLPLGLVGVCLRAASIRTLGDAFLDGADWGVGQERIGSGVYRLRHPAELGTLLILAGTCLTSGSPAASLILGLGVIPTSVARVLQEERRQQPRAAPHPRRS